MMIEPLPFSSTDYHCLSALVDDDCAPLVLSRDESRFPNTESFWFLAMDHALEPTPISDISMRFDNMSKVDAIHSFISLASQHKDFPSSEDDLANTNKASQSHCKRQPSVSVLPSSCFFQGPGAKRQRTTQCDEHNVNTSPQIRDDQNKKWQKSFQQLLEFKRKNGHTCVPKRGGESHGLLQWVKRQRYQYKLLQEGKKSTMTLDPINTLENIGFVWDSHASQWEERFEELQQYRLTHGNANIPSNFQDNPKLSTWVKRQRREFRLRRQGKVSGMSDDRIEALNSVGFQWNGRNKSE